MEKQVAVGAGGSLEGVGPTKGIMVNSITIIGINKLGVDIALSEKAMAPHSSTLAWKIPWIEEPGRLQSMGLLRVGHD